MIDQNRACVVLWRNVIERAMMDALGIGLSSGMHNAGKKRQSDIWTRKRLRDEAKDWFGRSGRDFVQACECAEYESAWVRKQALDLFKEFGDELVGCKKGKVWEEFSKRGLGVEVASQASNLRASVRFRRAAPN